MRPVTIKIKKAMLDVFYDCLRLDPLGYMEDPIAGANAYYRLLMDAILAGKSVKVKSYTSYDSIDKEPYVVSKIMIDGVELKE